MRGQRRGAHGGDLLNASGQPVGPTRRGPNRGSRPLARAAAASMTDLMASEMVALTVVGPPAHLPRRCY